MLQGLVVLSTRVSRRLSDAAGALLPSLGPAASPAPTTDSAGHPPKAQAQQGTDFIALAEALARGGADAVKAEKSAALAEAATAEPLPLTKEARADSWDGGKTFFWTHSKEPIDAGSARETVERIMLNLQKANGEWAGTNGAERNVGQIYCTSLAILSLSVKYHFLPIYQD